MAKGEDHMTNVVIVAAGRSAVGSFNGSFANTPAHDLGAAIIEGVMARYLKGVMGDDTVDTDVYKLQIEQLADESLRLLRGLH